MRKIVISVSLAAETVGRLEKRAHDGHISLSSLARRLITEGLKNE
jgi:hypothetical protein